MAISGTAEIEVEGTAPAVLEFNIPELVRLRAYELYVERGRIDGFAQEDWLRAESEILLSHGSAIAEGTACAFPCATDNK